jgi:hypothetical protein
LILKRGYRPEGFTCSAPPVQKLKNCDALGLRKLMTRLVWTGAYPRTAGSLAKAALRVKECATRVAVQLETS